VGVPRTHCLHGAIFASLGSSLPTPSVAPQVGVTPASLGLGFQLGIEPRVAGAWLQPGFPVPSYWQRTDPGSVLSRTGWTHRGGGKTLLAMAACPGSPDASGDFTWGSPRINSHP